MFAASQVIDTLGLTVLSPYYRSFATSLSLHGNERVLDFGSGSGICSRHIAARLQRNGGQLDCVDVSHGWMNVVRNTSRRYDNVSYHLEHTTQLDLPESAYDAVVIHFVLHDIPTAECPGIVKALARRLKPEGRLICLWGSRDSSPGERVTTSFVARHSVT